MPKTANAPWITGKRQNRDFEIAIGGNWLIGEQLPAIEPLLGQLESEQNVDRLLFATDGLERWDSLLIAELISLIDRAQQHGVRADTTTLPAAMQGLLKLVYAVPERVGARRGAQKPGWPAAFIAGVRGAARHAARIIEFTGALTLSAADAVRGRSHFRGVDFWLHIQECGPSALPIVTLISLLVGLILAFVGAQQLSLFGAQIYIANLVSLGMTREMGGLMTAVIMSGRTGAAYAAQLGTMHVNSEIDALKTMNLEPMAFLVLPRMLALSLILPLLCLYADLMGIVGGGLVTISFFDISLTEFLDRSAHAAHIKDFLVGFVKSAVFGVLIALSGCMRGMQCGQSASAVGDAATSAVVTSIVFIVIADSIMTIIFNRLGI